MADPSTSTVPDPMHVIASGDDATVVNDFEAWRSQHPDEPVILVFGEPELAAIFRDTPQVAASVAWLPAVARRVAAELPPRPRSTVAPSPIVIGDGRIARHLVAAMVEGWADPGQPLEVHCVGTDPAWAQEAEIVVGPQGRLTWSQLPLRPVPVVRRIRELVRAWQAPARRKGDPVGPTVLIALEAADVAMSLGVAIGADVPDARVGVLLEHAAPWPPVPGTDVFDLGSLRRAVARGSGDPVLEELFAEVAWVSAPSSLVTRPEVPIFAEAAYADGGAPLPFEEQPAPLQDQLSAVAAALPEILAAGALTYADRALRAEPVVLTPNELLAMAREILRALRVEDDQGARQTAIELAYLLPGIVARAGRPLQRPEDYRALLTFGDVERLAPLVHLAYQDVSAETDNATGSPLAGALWDQLTEFERAGNRAVLVGAAVCHAVLGLTWQPAAAEAGQLVLDVERNERLAELEHRRWAIHQRRNGAEDHQWMKPWNGPEGEAVTEGAKEYDRHIVRQILRFVQDVGIEVVQL
ncbi:hypothetical protein [Granulicoccus sp. GXG6511]|uniref:hypothetical protein n=1 Tax=Granulicoccus sp. GXG6511 TaxID=3381351 RepID=UPI003D7CD498